MIGQTEDLDKQYAQISFLTKLFLFISVPYFASHVSCEDNFIKDKCFYMLRKILIVPQFVGFFKK